MSQQFRIDSQSLRDKLNSLLPSQARGSINVDLSGQTTIVPIVDLTETAEGSSLRQDLQSSISFTSATAFNVSNAKTTIVTTTGYFRIIGTASLRTTGTAGRTLDIIINDGVTDKIILGAHTIGLTGANDIINVPIDLIVLLTAGDSLIIDSGSSTNIVGSTRQIADLSGNLTNP